MPPRNINDPAVMLQKERAKNVACLMKRFKIKNKSVVWNMLVERDEKIGQHESMFYKMLKDTPGNGWEDVRRGLARLFAELELNDGRPRTKAERAGAKELPPDRVLAYAKKINGEPAGLDLPGFEWLLNLVSAVQQGTSAWLRLLPGNGVEQLAEVLERRCQGTAVLTIDLTALKPGETLIEYLSGLRRDLVGSNHRSEAVIAGALTGEQTRLVFVVIGAGGYERSRGGTELAERLRELERFDKLGKNPQVVVVLVSPMTYWHLLPPLTEGSLPQLVPILADDNEQPTFEAWAKKQLEIWPSAQRTAILAASKGRVGAVFTGMRSSPAILTETMLYQHQSFGKDLHQKYLGSCCVEALNGKPGREECLRLLTAANAIKMDGDVPRPVMDDWRDVWVR